MLALLALLATADFCADLEPERIKGAVALAPIKCEQIGAARCTALVAKLRTCMQRGRMKVIEPDALKTTLQELQRRAMKGKPIDAAAMAEVAGGLGASYVLTTEIGGDKTVALVRLVAIEQGTVAAAARVTIDERRTGISFDSVSAAMTQLADKLAAAVEDVGGSSKKKHHVAVMKFSESGALATKNGMGTLVSAELVMRLRGEHGMLVVERSRLDQVLKEFELGQLGLVDPKNAPKLGKMVDAEAMVLGSVVDAGAEIKIYAQLIDVATGVTLSAESVSLKSGAMITLASDAVALRTKSGALFRSLLVPGWGQMYNKQPVKGGVILGAVLGLGGGAIAMHVLNVFALNAYNHAGAGADFDGLVRKAETFGVARTALLAVMGVVWIYNLIDAYVNGVTFDTATATGGSAAAFSF